MSDRVTLPMASATAAQLREFAQTVLGLDIPLTLAAPKIIALIASTGYDKADITIEDTLEAAPARKSRSAPVLVAESEPDEDRFITVLIDKTEGKGGDEPVFVSVNGRGMLIERGKPQRIRASYEEVLKNAVGTVYEQADGHAPLVPRDVLRFPFRVVGQG